MQTSTGLNDSLKDNTSPLSSPEDIFSKLNSGKVFSMIDLSEAYLQEKVDEELFVMNTHKGCFELNRLPLSLNVAPSSFQQVICPVGRGCRIH